MLSESLLKNVIGLTVVISSTSTPWIPYCLSQVTTGEPMDYDASPCDYILSLKLCLLDTIHGFYVG